MTSPDNFPEIPLEDLPDSTWEALLANAFEGVTPLDDDSLVPDMHAEAQELESPATDDALEADVNETTDDFSFSDGFEDLHLDLPEPEDGLNSDFDF